MSIQFSTHARRRMCSTVLLSFAVVGFAGGAAAQSMSLKDVLARTATADPSARANAARMEAAGAVVRSAEFGPRPRVGIDLEDFAGTGPYRGADTSQTTAYYEQVWERGGKRGARLQLAQTEQSIARHRANVRMLDLFEKVQISWADAQATQAAIAVAEERVALAERIGSEVARRTSRALDPAFANERVRTALAQARIARDQAVEAARTANATLSTWWGGTGVAALDTAEFRQTNAGSTEYPDGPDLGLLAAERDAADASARLAEANSYTDPTLRVGVRRFGQGNNVAVVVGGSIPVGMSQAGQPAIAKAQAERVAAEAELATGRLQARREISRLNASRTATASEISRIDQEVLPVAERAAALVLDGYNRGGTAFTYLEVAEAQRAVLEAKSRRIELLRRFHLDGARLDRLSGRHLSLIASEERR
jgi:cobalt-zinc-cadmium efflux system outer membrane protein